MTVKLLTEQHLEFLSLKGGCTGLSESTLVKMPHCWKSHVAAQVSLYMRFWYLSYFSPNDVVSQNVGRSCEQADHVRNCQRRILVSNTGL